MKNRKMQRFQRWMRKNGIEHSGALEFQVGGEMVSGTGVKALCDLKEGELIAKIPKTACLTVLTTGAAQDLKEAELAGGLGLVAAVMYERSRGKDSPWFGYLKTLPSQEPVPSVWSDEEIDSLLVGTELHKVIKGDKKLMEEDWEENIKPLCEHDPIKFPAEHFTFERYSAAKSLFSSRCFQIDEFHGHGFVPLADLFNHKTNAEDVHFMTNDSDSDDDDSSQADEQDDSTHKNDNEVLEMVMVKDVAAGSEIFNTYGQLSNAALLDRYGFTEPDNPFDIVNVDMDCVTEALIVMFNKKHVRLRGKAWRRAGFTGCESEGCEYFEIDACGKLQVELLLLLFLMHCSADPYTRLKENASKVHGDVKKAGEVLGWQEEERLVQKKKKRKRVELETSFSALEKWLLTPPVIETLLMLMTERDKQYGNMLEDDEKRFKSITWSQSPREFHALSLRLAERKILRNCSHALEEFKAAS